MKVRQDITAIIYNKKGKVLSIGKNNYVKTHPLQAAYAASCGQPDKIYLHAEIDAIIKCKSKGAYKIRVFRVLSDGSYGNAAPCPICQTAIKAAGIKLIEHT